ncbi:MAG: HD domain-containing protein [Thermodesulfovibrionales bacterium]
MTHVDKTLAFLSDFMTAFSSCSLYSPDHPAALQFAERAVRRAEPLYVEDAFSLALIGGGVVSNERPLTTTSVHAAGFARKMKRKGLEKIVFRRGLTAEELKKFIVELASAEHVHGAYQHISFGVVEVKIGGGNSVDAAAITAEGIEKLKEVYRGVSKLKRLDMVGLEDIVVSFIATLRQEANVLRVISPVKTYSEYTYTHNTNVAILSIFQAEALGIKKDLLHDIGLAGLLHDVGKMFISKEVLNKPGKLDEKEWREMQMHPSYGAMYIATLPEVPRIALIAAYEHHMSFDGSGYPDTKRRGRRQHVISQIIAISDLFDALRAERPYHKAFPVPAIVGMLRESKGKNYNPLLVENFLAALNRVRAI